MPEQIIRRARRRLVIQDSLRQTALALSVAVAGLAMLLIVGTRYLEWWALTLLTVAALGYALYRIWRNAPDPYATAVRLDQEAGLHDALSTAHYFSTKHDGAVPNPVIAAQLDYAQRLAGSLNVSTAIPFRVPKAVYALAIMLAASTGLVTVRYFVGGKLDLQRPLTEVLFEDLAVTKAPPKPIPTGQRKDRDAAESLLERLGFQAKLPDNPNSNLEDALAKALEASKPSAEGADAKPGENQGGEKTKSGDKAKNGDQASKDAQNNEKQAGDPMAGDKSSKDAAGKSGSEKSGPSLLSKLKEAMDNIVGSPQADNDLPPKSDGKQQSKGGQKASQQAGQEKNSAADPNGKSEGEAQAGKTEGKSSGSNDPKDGPSAAGADDGQKAIKLAQQLKAMGKLSEIIGKRAGQVKGETMVEVSSGDQKLHSTYGDKTAAHGEGKGEVSRDAIPLASQSYVQQYFERVRKSAPQKN